MYAPLSFVKEFEIKNFYTAFEMYCSSTFSYSGESHDFWEMVYVIDGSVGVSADERVYTLSRNNIIFHKPMEFHRIWSERGTSPSVFIMSFSLNRNLRSFNSGVFELDNTQRQLLFELMNFLRMSLPEYDPYCARNDFLPSKRGNDNTLLHFAANYAEIFLLSLKSSGNMITSMQTKEALIYKNAVRVMEKNIYADLSVPEIAELCMVSKSTLKDIFSKYAGIGIHKYYLLMKINYSLSLLSEGYSVAEISRVLSFSSQNYFSMVFRREMGMSPSEYKKKSENA